MCKARYVVCSHFYSVHRGMEHHQKNKDIIHATKFVARLVGQDPEDYCIGIVPFDFNDIKAADKAKMMFLPGSVWKLEAVSLVTSNDLKFLGCTVNVIVDLNKSKVTLRLR